MLPVQESVDVMCHMFETCQNLYGMFEFLEEVGRYFDSNLKICV